MDYVVYYTLDSDLLNPRSVVRSSHLMLPFWLGLCLWFSYPFSPYNIPFRSPTITSFLRSHFTDYNHHFRFNSVDFQFFADPCLHLNMDLCSGLMTTSSALSCLRVLVNEHLSAWFLTCVSLDLVWPCLDVLPACLLGLDFLKIALNRLDVPYR